MIFDSHHFYANIRNFFCSIFLHVLQGFFNAFFGVADALWAVKIRLSIHDPLAACPLIQNDSLEL